MRIKDTHAHVDANKNKCSVHYLVRELLISIHGSPLQARWKLFFIHQIYREICQYKPPCFRTRALLSAGDLRRFPFVDDRSSDPGEGRMKDHEDAPRGK